MRRNRVWSFLFSFCPGAGQMYQGYMKRGLSLILLFMVPIVVGAYLMPVVMSLSAVVYMYSFFDSLNLRAQIREYEDGIQMELPEDDYLIRLNIVSGDLQKLLVSKNRLIGWGLVALGLMGLYTTLLEPVLGELVDLLGDNPVAILLRRFLYSAPQMVVGVLFVLVGIWLLKGGKKKQEDDFEDYRWEDEPHE